MRAERRRKDPREQVATTLNRYATPVPMAISVNMLVLRFTTEAQPRWKNGQPPQRTTGVASSSSSQGRSPSYQRIDDMNTRGPQHAAHGDRQERCGQRQADPKAPRHVPQFGIVFVYRHRARLERHAADRTSPRLLRAQCADASGRCTRVWLQGAPATRDRAPFHTSDRVQGRPAVLQGTSDKHRLGPTWSACHLRGRPAVAHQERRACPLLA